MTLDFLPAIHGRPRERPGESARKSDADYASGRHSPRRHDGLGAVGDGAGIHARDPVDRLLGRRRGRHDLWLSKAAADGEAVFHQ